MPTVELIQRRISEVHYVRCKESGMKWDTRGLFWGTIAVLSWSGWVETRKLWSW